MNTRISELYDLFLHHRKVSTDSRQIDRGSLFFALKGDHFDGNNYAEEALEKGAAYAVVDDPKLAGKPQILQTDSVLKTLQDLAKMHRKHIAIPVIGITGTNGKTSTKELTHAVLSRKYKAFATKGNLNNHIGVPISILSIGESDEIAVIELGANHIGEIAFLCSVADPDYGLITNVGKAHLEGFGSFEGVIKAKTELYKYLENKNGLVFINKEDRLLYEHASGLKRITYGAEEGSDCRLELVSEFPSLAIQWHTGSGIVNINSSLYGAYNFHNINAAVCIGDHFEISPEEIRAGIESYVPRNSRSELIRSERNTIYMDAYNANPTSMELALMNFERVPEKKKMLVLGDMLELGDDADEEHRKIASLVKSLSFDQVCYVGPLFARILEDDNIVFPDVEHAGKWLEKYAPAGYAILLKGSRKIELEKLLDIL
jgi:UDP-N-acetylmuramoyl-tripeptide--D-alanyl-D-alanine ligase